MLCLTIDCSSIASYADIGNLLLSLAPSPSARAGTAGIPAVPPPPSEVPSVSHAFGEGDGAGEVWTIPVGPDGCIHEHFLIKLVAAVRADRDRHDSFCVHLPSP